MYISMSKETRHIICVQACFKYNIIIDVCLNWKFIIYSNADKDEMQIYK